MCTSEQRDHCGERGGGPSQDRLVDLDARPGRAASIAPPFRRLSAFPVGCTTQPQTLGILPTLCPRLLSDLQARAKSKATAQPPKSGKDSVSAVLSHWLGPGCFTGSPGKSHKNTQVSFHVSRALRKLVHQGVLGAGTLGMGAPTAQPAANSLCLS